jgi:hypothetical protein
MLPSHKPVACLAVREVLKPPRRLTNQDIGQEASRLVEYMILTSRSECGCLLVAHLAPGRTENRISLIPNTTTSAPKEADGTCLNFILSNRHFGGSKPRRKCAPCADRHENLRNPSG